MSTTFLNARLQKRRDQGTIRSLAFTPGLIDLTSNDYFGFANDCKGLNSNDTDRSGATGSRLLTGNNPPFEELEQRIARFHRAESCLICNSGYSANLGLLSALGTDSVNFLYDIEVHASMIDGMRLSRATRLPFRHNDLVSLESRLKRARLPAFVLVESIYSISGDVAPLQEIASLCAQYGAHLIVDEAHATGICGPNGEGLVVALGLESRVFARMHTFSKALGAQGACVVGSRALKEYLLNFARPLIYTTALSSSTLTLIASKYEKLAQEAQLHQRRLKALASYFCAKTDTQTTPSPIKPIYVADVLQLRALSKRLQTRGLDVRAILPPTVNRRKSCLRVVLHSFNQEVEIDQLVEAF